MKAHTSQNCATCTDLFGNTNSCGEAWHSGKPVTELGTVYSESDGCSPLPG